VPEHPFPGQRWREVRHDNTVTWLAYWRDTVNPKEFKYVWLSANSSFKSESDLLKYEKARKLKDYIEDIRAAYTRDWGAKDARKRQMGVALYFLDKLALRAGHEKDEDEADTVGCCTLKVENVACVPPSQLKFDFLGKDSIKYENTVDVDERVYKAVETFLRVDERGRRKGPRDMLFDTFDATDLNKELKGLMDGLSVKVFRTYNASITLDRLLYESEAASRAHTVDEKKADYDRANKEVAVLCNHQRSVPKTHGAQMDKMAAKLDEMRAAIKALEADLKRAKHGQATADGKKLSEDTVKSRLEAAKKRLAKAELAAAVKEDLKTVALGTSKINYMDPRITIAWCKRNEVPIEKVFNKSLISKFHWAMDADWQFRF
jgi:DNA topoisomerase-1